MSLGVETAPMQIRGSIINGSVRLGAYSNAPIPLICDNWRHEARDGLVALDICIFEFHIFVSLHLRTVVYKFKTRHTRCRSRKHKNSSVALMFSEGHKSP